MPSRDEIIEITDRVAPRFAGMRLDRYLTTRYRLSRTRAQKIIARTLWLNDRPPKKAGLRVRAGDRILIRRPAPKEPPVPRHFTVLNDGGSFLAIDKPAGLPVHPAGNFVKNTLTAVLKERYGTDPAPVLAHRLDRETSGVLLVARTKPAEKKLKQAFEQGATKKIYHTIVWGRILAPASIDRPLGRDPASIVRLKMGVRPAGQGASAVTHYRPLAHRTHKDGRPLTLLEVCIETGRQHQIRAHLEAAGHPVVGDKIYGGDPNCFLEFIATGLTPPLLERLVLPRQALHATACTFPHPDTGTPLTAEAPFPPDLKQFWQALTPDTQ